MLMWEGRLDLRWVDWNRVRALYENQEGSRHYRIFCAKILDSLIKGDSYHEDYPSILMVIDGAFKLPFNDLPRHLNQEALERAVVLYRLEVGR